MFRNQLRPRPKNLIVAYTVPNLARTEVESAYHAQVNRLPALAGQDLFIWDTVPRFAKGAPVPPRASMRLPIVLPLNPRTAAVTSSYPFDDARWQLMDFARDRIRHIVNASHLFLPFQPAAVTAFSCCLCREGSRAGWMRA